MEKLLACVLALGFLGTSAILVSRDMSAQSDEQSLLAADAAFRDGLYVGQLARAAHRPMHPPTGRWVAAKDRVSFARGYRQGFATRNSD